MSNGKRSVLFICVDDLRPELGCYGCTHAITPHIDRLAGLGCRFERNYCQIALCNPSRASMLTGKRPDELSVWGLDEHFRETHPDVVTLPQHFMRHGYHAAAIGKIYHNDLPDPKSWSEPRIMIDGYPYDPDAVYRDDGNVHYLERRKREIREAGNEKRYLDRIGEWYLKASSFEMPDVDDNAYYDGAQTDVAVQRLGELAAGEKPFFFAIGYYRPHLPFNVPKRYWDLYDREAIELAEFNLPPLGAPPMALNNMRELRGYVDFKDAPHPNDAQLNAEDSRLLRHGYFASVSYVDAQIGRLLDRLEGLGVLDDLIIVLWGDNGWKLGDYGSWCKMTNYETDTRVPLLIKPGRARQPGRACGELVESVDIYPTVCDLAGLPHPEGLKGTSLVPLIEDPKARGRGEAFSQFLRYGIWGAPDGKETMGYTLRTDRWRYVEWFHADRTEVLARELYDLHAKRLEFVNVSGRTEYREVENDLSQRLTAYRGQTLPLARSLKANRGSGA